MKPNPSLSERERNRQLMPTVAKFVEDMRKIFGDGIVVTYAAENGHVRGEKGPEGVRVEKRHVHVAGGTE